MSQIIRYILKEDSNCIDVGAHNGDVLAEILQLSPLGNHYAFEPLPDKARSLRELFPQVKIYEVALGDKKKEANFFYNVSNPGYSGLKQRRYDKPPTEIRNITVQVCRLDDIIPPDLPIDFIKIDVEGGEYQVMKGAVRTIKTYKPYIIFEHGKGASPFYGTTPSMVYDLLVKECGLKIFFLDGSGPLSESAMIDVFENESAWNFLAHP